MAKKVYIYKKQSANARLSTIFPRFCSIWPQNTAIFWGKNLLYDLHRQNLQNRASWWPAQFIALFNPPIRNFLAITIEANSFPNQTLFYINKVRRGGREGEGRRDGREGRKGEGGRWWGWGKEGRKWGEGGDKVRGFVTATISGARRPNSSYRYVVCCHSSYFDLRFRENTIHWWLCDNVCVGGGLLMLHM